MSAKQLALHDVYERLVRLLDELAARRPDGSAFVAETPTHREMASRLGCSREMVSRLMKDLTGGGFILVVDDGWQVPRPLPSRW